MAALGFFLCERHPSRRNDLIFLCVASAVMVAFSTVRGLSVGIDYKDYLAYFQQVCENGFSYAMSGAKFPMEPGYRLLNYLISLVSDQQLVFAFVIALISVGLRAVFVYRYSSSVWMSYFLFVAYGFFGYTLCTIRNEIAIGIFLFALPFLQKKKFVPYLLICLLAATFHISMLVWVPVFFLAWIPLNWKSLAVYGAGSVLFLLFSVPILEFVTQYVYTAYQVDSYYMQGRDFRTGLVPIVTFGVFFLTRKLLLQKDPSVLPLLNLSMYAAILFVFTYKHFVFQRLGLEVLPVVMLLAPALLSALAPSAEAKEQLRQLKAKGNYKQAAQKRGKLQLEIENQQSLYYVALGYFLFIGFLYLLFLLSANRLALVPYVPFWESNAAAPPSSPITITGPGAL